jgi:membrane associated rhomboid family serine protease
MSYGQKVYAPPLSKTNKIILITLAIGFVLYSFFTHVLHIPIESYLGLNYEMVKKGWLFQIVTYPFITRGIFEMLFNGLLIWFLGYDLEYRWGRKFYLMLFVISIISSGVFYLLFNMIFYTGTFSIGLPMVGLAGVCSSLLVSYAFIYPDREFAFMLIFPIKAKYFVGLLIVMELYFSMLGANKAGALAHLLTIFITVVYLVFIVKEKNNLWRMKVKKKSSFNPLQKKTQKRSGHLSLVKEYKEEDKPKYWH